MKITYLNDFYSGTGYSQFGIDTVLSMDSVGIDVVPRSFKLATQHVDPPTRLKHLEGKDTEGTTHIVQHTLPPYFAYRGGYKNIGFAHFETTHFRASGWQHYCNLMDEMWVSCEENKEAATKSGVRIPIKVVPKGAYVGKFRFAKLNGKDRHFGIGNRYAFYFIGDFSSKKNILNLIKCYFEQFTKRDNVVLVLKTYVEGVSTEQSQQIVTEKINEMKKSLRMWQMDMYPPIILISDYLPNREMEYLHRSCDCFVSLERGAGYNIGCHDALCYGNWVIANGWGGQTQFVRQNLNGNLVKFEMERVHGMSNCPYPTMFTAHEEWAEPNYNEFKAYMSNAYLNNLKAPEDSIKALHQEYCHKSVGEKIKEILSV